MAILECEHRNVEGVFAHRDYRCGLVHNGFVGIGIGIDGSW
ncbi:hypothetical protein [Nocardia salmonicida]